MKCDQTGERLLRELAGALGVDGVTDDESIAEDRTRFLLLYRSPWRIVYYDSSPFDEVCAYYLETRELEVNLNIFLADGLCAWNFDAEVMADLLKPFLDRGYEHPYAQSCDEQPLITDRVFRRVEPTAALAEEIRWVLEQEREGYVEPLPK